MRLTTWNVNGIRNPFSYPPWNSARSFPAMFDILTTDIIVMQELKIQRKDLRDDMVLLDGWDCYFSLPKHKKGYSGVGIYTRNSSCAPIRAEEGLLGVLPSPAGPAYRDLPADQSIGGYPSALQVAELGVDPAVLDAEGRCLVLEFPAFVLFGVYSPANSNGLRDDFRYGFICALDCRIRNLVKSGKRVVLVGDLNVSRHEIDTASTEQEMKKNGITHEEYISTPNRRVFNQLLLDGEVVGDRDEGREEGVLWDTTRAFHPERRGMYTHWEQKINARPGNFGSRIDFVLVSESMRSWVKHADIQEGLLGSDHCPVFAEFHDEVAVRDGKVKLVDIMNPPGTFVDGLRKREWKVQDVPAFSGKRLQEFDRRRSIKSMFAAPASRPSQSQSSPMQHEGKSSSNDREKSPDKSPAPTLPPSLPPPPPPSRQSSIVASPDKKRKATTTSKAIPSKKQKPDATVPPGKGQQSLKGFFQPRNPPIKSPSRSTQDVPAGSESAVSTIPESQRPDAANGTTQIVQEDDDALKATLPLPERPPSADATNASHAISMLASRATPPPQSNNDSLASPAPSATSAVTASSNQTRASTLTTHTIYPPQDFDADQTFDLAARQQTHHDWNNLFSRPVAPLCESHNEPCKSMRTKKKGENQGRSFWMCARPLGPSGAKEKGTEWRCGTFVWCSDWSTRKGEG